MHDVANNLEEIQKKVLCIRKCVWLGLAVVKTCEESFTTPALPANETLETFYIL